MPTISSKKFWYITILILLLPIGIHWKLFINGRYTSGKVIGYHILDFNNKIILKETVKNVDLVSIINVTMNNDTLIYAPKNIIYAIDKSVSIIYNPKKQSDYIILSFSGLYLSPKGAFSLIILIFWFAFLLANKVLSKKRQ